MPALLADQLVGPPKPDAVAATEPPKSIKKEEHVALLGYRPVVWFPRSN